ncbi:type II secretion system protein [Stenotrophomonas sp. 24(2023)]|uniref:type II secretion system protein n=1 Tax=Stenotrophomonas sp. 24(2023) TaxID=3068324 RepID=UPI0027DF8B4E|nr:type II secretion system protein [Stenotrophomonas sp. 24(2023)]WMJ70179.1 type II secretion system protein [Stenotrophomonas sp. 24(2023)]
MSPRPATRGFTLIELLVSLTIVAILGTLLVPVAQRSAQRSQEQELRRDLREIRQAIDAYKRAWDEGRIEKEATATGYPPTLDVLVQGVSDLRSPSHRTLYFLRRVPRNPFNTDASLAAAQTWGLRSYSSEAAAPQAGEDVYDVYVPQALLGLNGVPYALW